MSAPKKFVIKRKAAVAPEISKALVVIEPVPAFVEELDEDDDDDDDESVTSTCCADCDEPFTFEEPVPALDYHAGRHEMRCPECRDGAPEKFAGEEEELEDDEEKVKAIDAALARWDVDTAVLTCLKGAPLRSAKEIAKILKPTFPDITKSNINSALYKALTKGLVVRQEPKCSPPVWHLK